MLVSDAAAISCFHAITKVYAAEGEDAELVLGTFLQRVTF